jgi:uncharacterized protein (TIGR02284 family)
MAEAITRLDRETVIKELNKLIHLDYDAVAAYEAAIERLNNAEFRERLREFKGDHQRHIHNLEVCVAKFGGKPAAAGDIKQVLTKGKVILGQINHDIGILEAMKSNEDQTNRLYEEGLQKLEDEPEVAGLLLRNLEDERRHRAWLVSTLDAIAI